MTSKAAQTLVVEQKLCRPADGTNEDICGAHGPLAWVIDGATSVSDERLLPGPSDAAWLVGAISEGLESHSGKDCSLRELLRTVLVDVNSRFNAEKRASESLPSVSASASMILVRIRAAQLQFIQISDCRALVEMPGEPPLALGHLEMEDRDLHWLNEIKKLHKTGVTRIEEVQKRLRPLIRRERKLINRPGGYSAVTPSPESADKAMVGEMSVVPGTRLLLLSDGFYRLVDVFGLFRSQELLAATVGIGLERLYTELRSVEDSDPDCLEYPRYKKSDDATAMVIRIDGAL